MMKQTLFQNIQLQLKREVLAVFLHMKHQKQLQLMTSPSQKSLTHATSDSQTSISRGFFLPTQNQKRFTRRNNNSYNSSLQKGKGNVNQDISQEIQLPNQLLITKSIQLTNNSINKLSSGFIKLNTCSRYEKASSRHNVTKSSILSREKQRQPRKSMIDIEKAIKQEVQTSKKSDQSSTQKFCSKINNIAVLKTQLQIKQRQVTILEDQKRRYKTIAEDLKSRQIQLKQILSKNQIEMRKIKQNLWNMEKKIQLQQQNDKKLEQENSRLKKQLFQANKQKKIMERQLNLFVSNKVPKNVRQLQSCREISLQQTLQQLRNQIKRNKSQTQKQMQSQIQKLRQQAINLRQQLNKAEIKTRLLQKKSCDANNYFQAYKAIKKQILSIKCQNKKISQQCQLLRNENVKMKKELKKIKSSTQGSEKKLMNKNIKGVSIIQKLDQKKNQKVQSQSQSLNLSLSVCSKLDESLYINL